jgi:hypothetical protein
VDFLNFVEPGGLYHMSIYISVIRAGEFFVIAPLFEERDEAVPGC